MKKSQPELRLPLNTSLIKSSNSLISSASLYLFSQDMQPCPSVQSLNQLDELFQFGLERIQDDAQDSLHEFLIRFFLRLASQFESGYVGLFERILNAFLKCDGKTHSVQVEKQQCFLKRLVHFLHQGI